MSGACKGCPDRFVGCHSMCTKPEHLEEVARSEKIREARRKKVESYDFYLSARRNNRPKGRW